MEGQFKIDFLSSINKTEEEFNKYSLKFRNTSSINFLKSSKNITISFRKAKLGGCMLYFSNEYNNIGCGFSLQEIQQKVINLLVELYNKKQ